MSPELLDPESFGLKESNPTKESDCYALGMVVYEVISGRAPFTPSRAPVLKVLRGERPERPRGDERELFTDDIWSVVQRCWEPQPSDRADARAVLLGLSGDPSTLRPPPDMDGTLETAIDGQFDTISNDSSRCSTFCLGLTFTTSRSCHITGSSIPRRNELLAVRQGGSREGWVGRLTRNARETFKAIA